MDRCLKFVSPPEDRIIQLQAEAGTNHAVEGRFVCELEAGRAFDRVSSRTEEGTFVPIIGVLFVAIDDFRARGRRSGTCPRGKA